MDDRARRRVERATVRLPGVIGQGVLVPGRFVLTAAHCVRWSDRGAMALGEPFLEPVETPTGERFLMEVVATEAVSDVAVLGPADEQQLPDDADRFDEWAEATEPVSLGTWDPPPRKAVLRADGSLERDLEPPSVGVHVRTVNGVWLAGRAVQHAYAATVPKVALDLGSAIPSGTSGGPVVDDNGQVVGMVSTGATIALLTRALPRWLWSRIRAADTPEAS